MSDFSCFFARELLPLYLEDQVDKDRKAKIVAHLKECSSCSEFFKRSEHAKNVLRELSNVYPKEELVLFLHKEHRYWREAFEKYGWTKWPTSLRWAFELGLVSLGLVLLINWFPWLNAVESIRKWRAGSTVATGVALKPSVTPELMVEAQTSPTPLATVTPEVVVVATPAPTPVAQVAKKSEPAPTGQNTGVWRGVLKVETLEDGLAQKITNLILARKGGRAGKVDLGWKREEGFYYHFLLPKSEFEELKDQLKEFGVLKLKFDAHPRILKDDEVRVIISVEEEKDDSESP